MNHVRLALTLSAIVANAAWAQSASHCTANEQTLFSCALKKGKVVSVCASKDLSPRSGYLQYRFGKPGKVELAIPKQTSIGLPELYLVASKDKYGELNQLTIVNGPYHYEIMSTRQFAPRNGSGYPTSPSSDSIYVDATNKSMKEGNIVFSDDCATLTAPVNAAAISALTGKKVEKGGF